jgi:hypothetical protein
MGSKQLEPLDYKVKPALQINEIDVESLTVVGLLVEKFLKKATSKYVSPAALSERDLPACVCMDLDGRVPGRRVMCYDEDRALACVVGKAILVKLLNSGMQMTDAIVEVSHPKTKKKLGDHDMILTIVRADLNHTLIPRLPLSCEVKLRRLWSHTGRQNTRKELRSECLDDLEWWEQEASKFSGRLILMAVFPEKHGDKFQLCADLKWNGKQRWTSLFGWDDAVGGLTAALRPPSVQASGRGCAQASSQAEPKAKAKAQAKAQARPQANDQQLSARALVDKLSFRNGVAEVKALLREAKKNPSKSSYWSKQARLKHHWNEQELYQNPRDLDMSNRGQKRKRSGGSEGWVATKRVLVQMAKDMKFD